MIKLGAVFELAYLALMTNLLLILAGLPLVAGLLLTDPARSWPLLAAVTPVCAPGLCAAFAVLAAFTADGSVAVAGTFARAWRATFRRATMLGAVVSGGLVVLGVDLRAAWGRPVGALAVPVLATAMVLLVAAALPAAVLIAERPSTRLRDALRAGLYLAVRRWYLTALSLAVLGLFEALLAGRPAIALGLAATPLLYAVWANTRFTLRPVLAPTGGTR
jgi:uncharacterized membrane protein YesL